MLANACTTAHSVIAPPFREESALIEICFISLMFIKHQPLVRGLISRSQVVSMPDYPNRMISLYYIFVSYQKFNIKSH